MSAMPPPVGAYYEGMIDAASLAAVALALYFFVCWWRGRGLPPATGQAVTWRDVSRARNMRKARRNNCRACCHYAAPSQPWAECHLRGGKVPGERYCVNWQSALWEDAA